MEENPNARLFSGDDGNAPQQTEEQRALSYTFGLNPNRVSALKDLWYEDLVKKVNGMKLPDAAKMEAVFKLTAGALLDMIGDAVPPESAPDVMSDFDVFIGVALTNKKYDVNLFAEQQRALESIDPAKFKDTEEYVRKLSDAEDMWWDIAQPLLGHRNPNDAIKETLRTYGIGLP